MKKLIAYLGLRKQIWKLALRKPKATNLLGINSHKTKCCENILDKMIALMLIWLKLIMFQKRDRERNKWYNKWINGVNH